MKKVSELLHTKLWIPQPDGRMATIPLKDVKEANEKLGVWTCLEGDFGVHVKEMQKRACSGLIRWWE